jgi:alpha-galactosidase
MNTVMLDALDLTKMIQATQRPRVADGVDPIRIGKTVFHYGVVTRSDSVLHVALDGNAARFSVQVGVDVRTTVHRDDPVDPATSYAEFLIQGDGRELARSGRMIYGEDAKRLEVDLAGIRNLVLTVTGGPGHTHASWADGVFSCNGQAPVTVLTPEFQSLWHEKKKFLQELADRHPDPRINGALIVGVRPDTPLLYPMAVTGKRPMTFLAQGLPDGLSLDPRTGIILGQAGKAGDYSVGLQATNAHGKAEAILTIRVGDTLCLTPPMGFLSWNVTEGLVNETFLRETAEAMVELGLRDVGYQYVNIDDCWQGSRDARGVLQPAAIRFPNGMKAVAGEVHSRGLKLGIYSGPCRTTCAGYHGSMNYEELDCATWQDWGIDYLKYDNAPDTPEAMRQALFDTVGEILVRGKRSIVYSISAGNIVRTAKHANLARVAGDLRDHWARRKKNHGEGVIESVERAVEFKGEQIPGFFNDPDMLMVGIHGRGASANDCTDCQGMSDTEYQSQISLWCMLGAPLFVSADIRMLDVPALRMLTNPEVIAIDQDPLCEAPRIIRIGDHNELWCRRLADGSSAIALFNRGENEATLTVPWADCGLPESCHVRDLWLRQDIGMVRASHAVSVAGHGVAVFKVLPLGKRESVLQ